MTDSDSSPNRSPRDRPKAVWRFADPLFEYPLVVPHDPAYAEIDIEPFATDEEVRWAKAERVRSLQARKKEVDRRLNDIYGRVPGLREAYSRVRDLEQSGRGDSGEARQAEQELARLEEAARRTDPDFSGLRREGAEILRRNEVINNRALDMPDERRAYDRSAPPLALLDLADCTLDGFTETATAFALLRRELTRFLETRGETVFHPSDLTREDFSADFSFHSLLDGEDR